MFRSEQTSESCPSFERSRFTPPTSTPSVVESMKVVFEKSTITFLPPFEITSSSCCLNSGAVYRSTSPASEITYVSSPSCSVLMSKFISSPGSRRSQGSRSRPGGSLTSAGGRGRLEHLEPLLHGVRTRIVRRELQELLVRRDRRSRVVRVLGRLRELD